MITEADIQITSFIMSMVSMMIISIKVAKDYHREHYNQKRFEREQEMRNEMIKGIGAHQPPRTKQDDDRPTFSDGIRQIIEKNQRLNKQD